VASNDYATALKRGKRKYQSALTRGEYPYLPVLDDILSYTEVASTVSLGLMDIPLSKVVGTKTAGRTNAFANNFMPLLPENSEFCSKWTSLYNHQINEGIRDPIVVYEFMARFYVQEGNKRVSVLKYLEAYSISATVTRLIPKKTEEKENRLYYEFLDFYQMVKTYDILFTREGSYKKLLKMLDKKPGEVMEEDERAAFLASYNSFTDAYQAVYNERLKLTSSDAFLVYLELYGYDRIKDESQSQMKAALQKIEKELKLAETGGQVELVQSPETAKPSLLNRLLPTNALTPEMLSIAFIYPKTAETSGWTYSHELGRLYLEQAFEGKLRTMRFDRATTDADVENAIEQAIAAGCNLIFTIAPQMINQTVRSAILHPQVRFYNCSVKMSYSSIHTYYARMYESKFLIGAIAAALSRTDRLGYVADYPIYGTIANINAYALGARMINPYVKVYLEWSRLKGQDAKARLRQEGIVFISDDDVITPEHASREYGLYREKEDGTLENLATPIWHWGKFYERIVRNLCNPGSDTAEKKGKKAVNYWWGMSADVIDVICSKTMPHGTHRLIEFMKNSIRAGSFHPFDGLIYSQNGEIRCKEGETLQPEEIITMDWLAENVVGQIPQAEELTEEGQALVKLQGVKADETDTEK